MTWKTTGISVGRKGAAAASGARGGFPSTNGSFFTTWKSSRGMKPFGALATLPYPVHLPVLAEAPGDTATESSR